ncbi:hypothetical protein DYB38_012355 [Aphanomyces astaci]|uniref:Origin recognition complex subunit 1 n=2 Tax=Aphanomyces astaci TaxID=112090 RepID=A0A397CKJ4_APHAT|nr:hypothetical protein DYB38_012355 [Aphanomyces astaci]
MMALATLPPSLKRKLMPSTSTDTTTTSDKEVVVDTTAIDELAVACLVNVVDLAASYICTKLYAPLTGTLTSITTDNDAQTTGYVYSRRLKWLSPAAARRKRRRLLDPSCDENDLEGCKSRLEAACDQLQLSSIPDTLLGREEERRQIYQTLKLAVVDGESNPVYISGLPGMGKTATVKEILRTLERERDAQAIPPFTWIEVNGLHMPKPDQAYSMIWKALETFHFQIYVVTLDVTIIASSDYTAGYAVPKPTWYNLSYEEGKGGEGQLLVSCTLVAKDLPDQVIDPPTSIKPKMQEKFLEIICLGLRDLSPIGFMPLHMPFLQFDIGEVSSSNRPKKTGGSSKPTPANPNFLERILIPIQLPEDAQFAPRLNLSVFDTLLGGFHKPLLGTCSIDLTTKLPFSNGVENPVYVAPGESTKYNVGNPHVDGPLVPKPAPSSSSLTCGDDGTGLPPLMRRDSSAVPEIGPDDDETPKYMNHRKVMRGSIEEDLQTTPFEVYEIFRGQKYGRAASTYRAVGKFKGLIRVINSRSEPPLFDLQELLNPQPYVIRV